LIGWEGSAANARVYKDAHSKDLHIPDGKYYLAHAGFPACQQLLIPYCGVQYHLAEWGHAGVRYVFRTYLKQFIYTFVVGQQIKKNYSTFTILQLVT
jgi:hypothetical protein